MKRLNSDEIKETIFNIMVYFDKLCRKHNLKYFLAGGTCLGAVRHKDFIPWDDDADILMDREDYDKFREIMQKENSQYKLLCYQDTKKYFYPFYKLVDTRTTAEEKYLKKIPGMGVWLDIFPINGVPEDKALSDKLIKKTQSLHYKLIASNLKFSMGTKRYAKKLNELALKYPLKDYNLAACSIWIGRENIYDKSFITDLVELPFHGYNFYSVKEYDKYLTGMYGDYMTPPPENKRKAHGFKAFLK